jgi:hypothetical protein
VFVLIGENTGFSSKALATIRSYKLGFTQGFLPEHERKYFEEKTTAKMKDKQTSIASVLD